VPIELMIGWYLHLAPVLEQTRSPYSPKPLLVQRVPAWFSSEILGRKHRYSLNCD
jgi:hypothetical protein